MNALRCAALLVVIAAVGCKKPPENMATPAPAASSATPRGDHDGPPAQFPYQHSARTIAPEDLDVLEHADVLSVIVLFSDWGSENKDGFHGYKVGSRADVKTPEARKAVTDNIAQSIRESDGLVAKCFQPHHAISARKGDKTVDLVICFECSQLYVYGARPSRVPIGTKNVDALDKLFGQAGAL